MAQMFPDEISSFTTPGERKFYIFLKNIAKPDGEFLVWHTPAIEDREPDFILFSPLSGLIVFEVKDWVSNQIIEIDSKTAILNINGTPERRKQPLAQAREYVNNILALFSKHAQYDKSSPSRLSCPVTWGAVFPHISRNEFRECGFGQVMNENRIIFWDDLQEESHLSKDKSGTLFREWLKEHFPPQFPFESSPEKIQFIRKLLFPVVRQNLPSRGGVKTIDPNQTLLALDHEQENIARSLGRGKLLIIGPPSSGKSLILTAQAALLAGMNKNISHILFTCFNLSLVGYLKRLLVNKNVCLGENGIEVIAFYKLCERIIGEPLAHANESADYYKYIIELCLEHICKKPELRNHWDAIFVDEGQDFSPAMARLLLELLPANGVLTIAQDENQSLYNENSTSWENLGIPDLKIRRLSRQYRNTKQIAFYAAHATGIVVSEENLEGRDGEKPKTIISRNYLELIAEVADTIAGLIRDGQPMSEIAVLYARSKIDNDSVIPELLIQALESHGVLARWCSRDASSKSSYDITTDSVTISSIYSVKGMDFANVFILNCKELLSGTAHRKNLAYVGMTRAREKLFICEIKS